MRVGDKINYGQVGATTVRDDVGARRRRCAVPSSRARVNIIYVIIFMVYIIEEWLRIQDYYYKNYIKSQM